MSCLPTLLHHALIMTGRTSESRRNAEAAPLYLGTPDGLGAQWLWGNRETRPTVKNDFGHGCWEKYESRQKRELPQACRSSITERSLCSSAVHLGTDPRAACDLNWAAQMMKLTAPTEVYAPYQGSEWGRSFSSLEWLVFDISLLIHFREEITRARHWLY